MIRTRKQQEIGDCREDCDNSAAELVCTKSLTLVRVTIPGAACSPLMHFSSWRAPCQSERSEDSRLPQARVSHLDVAGTAPDWKYTKLQQHALSISELPGRCQQVMQFSGRAVLSRSGQH